MNKKNHHDQKGVVTIEFIIILPVVLVFIIISIGIAKTFIIEAVLEWNLHEISRDVAILHGSDFEGVRNDVLMNNNFYLFSPEDVFISVRACETLIKWERGECIKDSTGADSWIVEYELMYSSELLQFINIESETEYLIKAIKIIRNEPLLPDRADLT